MSGTAQVVLRTLAPLARALGFKGPQEGQKRTENFSGSAGNTGTLGTRRAARGHRKARKGQKIADFK